MVSTSLAAPKEEMWLYVDASSKESFVAIEQLEVQSQGGKTPPQASCQRTLEVMVCSVC